LILFLIFIITGTCEKTTGPEGKKSLIKLVQELPGDNCATGGIKIISGTDNNANDILDEAEYQISEYICHGNNGLNSLYSMTELETESICDAGGLSISWGLDLNYNSILDSIEISKTENICNGNNGSNSLITTEPEPSGINCKAGGYKISSGVDLNNNNILDTVEIQSFEYICHGVDGKLDRQIRFDFNSGSGSYYFEDLTFTIIEYWKIVNFDLGNYPDIDSISFCA
jgi:hypothetical protein